jgi:ABC-type uncharacterized transport system permease subunit
VKFGQPSTLPRWAQLSVLPVLNLLAALLVTGLVTWMIGEDPWECLQLLVSGAFGSGEGIGYTLFYTTGFIFTGLAVATAFHAGLFNIGGKGRPIWLALASRWWCWRLITPCRRWCWCRCAFWRPWALVPPGPSFRAGCRPNVAATLW